MVKNESYRGIGLDSSNYGNYYNNNKIDLSNALYAAHRYGARKNTSVNDYWTIATKYIKGPIKSGGEAVTASTGPSKYEFAASTYDETNYNYDIRKLLYQYYAIREIKRHINRLNERQPLQENIDNVIEHFIEYISSFERGLTYSKKGWVRLMNILYEIYPKKMEEYL